MEPKKPISFAAAAATAAASKPAASPANANSGASTPVGRSTSSAPPTQAAAPATPATPVQAPSAPPALAGGKNGSNGTSSQSLTASRSQSPSPASVTPSTPTVAVGTDKANASSTIDWVLGKHVRVVTLSDEVFEGQVYAYDILMNCVVIHIFLVNSNNTGINNSNSNNGAVRPRYDFKILKINFIKDATPLSVPGQEQSGVVASSLSPSVSTKSNTGSTIAATSPNPDSSAASVESSSNNITNNIYSTIVPAVGYIQLDKIQQREQQAIREAQVAAARIGVGVSTIGQDIFDALSKT
ncbi:hypothetical protein BG004_004056 [Podila humilis]|nr:hypothetical protein BG004_004056 [Podila humilis]